MTDRNKTIDELTAADSIANNDLLIIEDVSEGETKTSNISFFISNKAELIGLELILEDSTPANSTVTVTKGRVFYDDDYIYLATSNNVLKRVALTAF